MFLHETELANQISRVIKKKKVNNKMASMGEACQYLPPWDTFLTGQTTSGTEDAATIERKKPKHIPSPLVLPSDNSIDEMSLKEFAILATSPRSPLMQRNLPLRKRAYSCNTLMDVLHSYARSPLLENALAIPSPLQATSYSSSHETPSGEDLLPLVSSSFPFPSSPVKNESSSGTWSHTWPTAVWHCFIKGTRIKFQSPDQVWQLAEDIGVKEQLALQADQSHEAYAIEGLQLIRHERDLLQDNECLKLEFRSCDPTQSNILAVCEIAHPFFVKTKGWSSFHSKLTAKQYGIPCRSMETGDICLAQNHPDAFSTDIFESIKTYDFTPEDTSAVFALSDMAKHRPAPIKCENSWTSPTANPQQAPAAAKAKRPMNGFMLFAKKYRVEYTQKYPGKDNRAISVLLGDTWKRMDMKEKHKYSEEARLLAEKQKQLHPDCWKRRRSVSGSI